MKWSRERALFYLTAGIGLAAVLWPLEIVVKRWSALSFYWSNWNDGAALPTLTYVASFGLLASLMLGMVMVRFAFRHGLNSSATETLARRFDIVAVHLFVFVLSWADWAIALPYKTLQSVH